MHTYTNVVEVLRISNYERTEKILKALASKPRLQILEYIRRGISHLNEIAQPLKLSKTTTYQHLNILLAEKIIQKVESISNGGQMTTFYKISASSNGFLKGIEDLCKDFIHTRA